MDAMEAHAEKRVVGMEGVTHYFMKAGQGALMIILAGLLKHEMVPKASNYICGFMECNDDRAYRTNVGEKWTMPITGRAPLNALITCYANSGNSFVA